MNGRPCERFFSRRRLARAVTLLMAMSGVAAAAPAKESAAPAKESAAPAPVTITVKSGPGATLAPGFLGLSFEVNLLAQPGLTAGNLAAYLETLGPGVLRFGGNQVDKAFWTSSGEKAPDWALTTLTPADLERLATLARTSGWKVILGVNLKHKDAARAADEARVARKILGDALLAIEVGNEPNYYSKEIPNYSPAQYHADFELYRAAIAGTAPGVGLLGPSGGSAPSAIEFLNGFAKLQQTLPRRNLESLSTHFYPACGRNTPTPTMAELLSPEFQDRIRTRVQMLVDAARPLGVKTRLDECNSLTCGGVEGVSDRYGAALWAVDQAMLVASLGVTAENFHSNIAVCGGPRPPGAAYTPFCAPNPTDQAAGKLIPQPEYYALLMVREIGTGTFTPIDNSDAATLRAYALRSGNKLKLVLDNLQDPARFSERKVTVKLGGRFGRADFIRMTGPGLDATSDIKLAGNTVANDGSFPAITRTPLKVKGTTLTMTVPAGSATLVTLSP
jgi:hypothetical protein